MRTITLKLDLFAHTERRESSEAVLRLLLEVLCAADVLYLQEHPRTPPLYRAGVRYREERAHVVGGPIPEEWKAIPYVLADGFGDCEDLACWRVAELLCQGIAAQPQFSFRMLTPAIAMYHITVRHPDGRTEDPSRRLGMR